MNDAAILDELKLLLSDYLKRYPKRGKLLLEKAPNSDDTLQALGILFKDATETFGTITKLLRKPLNPIRIRRAYLDERAGVAIGDIISSSGQKAGWLERSVRVVARTLTEPEIIPLGHEALTEEHKIAWFCRVSQLVDEHWRTQVPLAQASTFRSEMHSIKAPHIDERQRIDIAEVSLVKTGVFMGLKNYISGIISLPKEIVGALKASEVEITQEMRLTYENGINNRNRELTDSIKQGMKL